LDERCPNEPCGLSYPPHVDRCPHCGTDVGFPNVRAASRAEERQTLEERYQAALTAARAEGREAVVCDFAAQIAKSRAVMCRQAGALHSLPSRLIATYQQEVDAGLRPPDTDKWAWARPAGEERWFGGYTQHIHYAVLSLDDRGATRWGPIELIFREPLIAKRTSVGEANVVRMAMQLRPEDPMPPGYRAPWNERAKLCVAKLAPRLVHGTKPDDYARILLADNDTTSEPDFVEVHIYGPLTADSLARVRIPKEYEQEFTRVAQELRSRNIEVEIVDTEVSP
jgi:hypothetical protein